jgi:hypothetical protein
MKHVREHVFAADCLQGLSAFATVPLLSGASQPLAGVWETVSSNTDNSVGTTGWKPSGSPASRTAAPTTLGAPVRPPTAARERKPALAALALLLIAVGVLASVYLQMQAGNRVGVVELSQRVPQGRQITSAEITEVMVAQDKTINYVTWAQRGLLSRYTTQTDLVPGTILVGQMLTTEPAASGSAATIPVTLKSGQFPPSIEVGDTVNAYYVGAPQGTSSSSSTSASSTNDVSTLLSSAVKVLELPAGTSGSELGSSSSSSNVFEVSADKSVVDALLTASAEGDLVFTSGASS